MWNDCDVVYEGGEFDYFEPELNNKVFNAFRIYRSMIGHEPKEKVWFDFKDEVCFGAEQTFYDNPSEFSFFANEDNFLNDKENPYWSRTHTLKKLGGLLGHETEESSELIIPKEIFNIYNGKHILIVGAGPSTDELNWDAQVVDYNYLWTCNNFFLNDKLQTKTVDLAVLGPDVDLTNLNLIEKLNKDDTLSIFEGGASPFRNIDILDEFRNNFEQNKVSYYHMRYFSKIGVAARMIVFASLLGAKKVSFVGIDGHPLANKHSFEGENKQHHGAPLVANSVNIFRRQYVLLWDYILNKLAMEVEFENLGESHDANLSKDISKGGFII